MTAAAPTITTEPVPAYPIAQPDDDHRFCYGLGIDVGEVLAQYGYPPVRTGKDLGHIMNALFRLIYQENQP
jgi:hypothetical protein